MAYPDPTHQVNDPHAHRYSDPRHSASGHPSHVHPGRNVHPATLSHSEQELSSNYLASRYLAPDETPSVVPHRVQYTAREAATCDTAFANTTFVSQAWDPALHHSSYSSLAGALDPRPTSNRTTSPPVLSSGTIPQRGHSSFETTDWLPSPHTPYCPSTSSSASPPPVSPSAPHFRSTPRRNKPASSESALSPLSWPDNTWQCPYCPYTHLNKRGPDFRRHVETHSQAALWVCCGAPPEDLRAREGVPREVLARPPIEFEPGL
ncbi:hypothetical protein BD413DRAFT_197921 [Trametes elegans]|nr:hypothetical protein BD413DRAFT_197921 [Trametes elegans]